MTPTLLYIQAKHAFEQLREEIRNRNLEEINMLRISLDAQIEELEQHFETAHLNYLQQTAQRTHDFKELTQNDQRLSRDIELKKKKIDGLQVLPPPPLHCMSHLSLLSCPCHVMPCHVLSQTSIQQWRAKIRQLNRETEERNRLLLDEKHSIQKHYQQLKQRIQAYRWVLCCHGGCSSLATHLTSPLLCMCIYVCMFSVNAEEPKTSGYLRSLKVLTSARKLYLRN